MQPDFFLYSLNLNLYISLPREHGIHGDLYHIIIDRNVRLVSNIQMRINIGSVNSIVQEMPVSLRYSEDSRQRQTISDALPSHAPLMYATYIGAALSPADSRRKSSCRPERSPLGYYYTIPAPSALHIVNSVLYLPSAD